MALWVKFYMYKYDIRTEFKSPTPIYKAKDGGNTCDPSTRRQEDAWGLPANKYDRIYNLQDQ